MSSEPVYQLKVTLKAIEPAIWRRVRVRGGILLPRLHAVIQKTMGWQDAHLHEFVVGDVRYGEPEPDEPEYDVRPERDFSLRELAPLAGLRFEYIYDLGDGWLHDILVEQVDPPAESLRAPVCLAGERASPPEDCGGFPGYEELLEILRDPDHPEHEERLEWLGGRFDPEAFDLAAVNRKLGRLRRYDRGPTTRTRAIWPRARPCPAALVTARPMKRPSGTSARPSGHTSSHLQAHNEPIPQNDTLVHVEELTIGVP